MGGAFAAGLAIAALGVVTAPLGFAATPGTWNIATKTPNAGTSDNRLFATACAPVTSYCLSVGYYRSSSGNDQTLVEAGGIVISSGNANSTNDNILEGVTCVKHHRLLGCWLLPRTDANGHRGADLDRAQHQYRLESRH